MVKSFRKTKIGKKHILKHKFSYQILPEYQIARNLFNAVATTNGICGFGSKKSLKKYLLNFGIKWGSVEEFRVPENPEKSVFARAATALNDKKSRRELYKEELKALKEEAERSQGMSREQIKRLNYRLDHLNKFPKNF